MRTRTTAMLVMWILLAGVTGAARAQTTVKYPELIDCYNWTRGCTPTAAAMVFSYWDNYSAASGLKYVNWGRLIDFYYSPDGTNNVPNLIDDLADEFGTNASGGTRYDRIRGGLQTTFENVNSYEGTIEESWGDFNACWTLLKSEIDNNRPCLWSVGEQGTTRGHSTAAWGYRQSWFTRWITLYDTWDWNPVLPYEENHREEWNLLLFYDTNGATSGTPAESPLLNTLRPHYDPDKGNDIILDQPYGGEVIPAGKPYTIWWYQYGNGINSVTLDMSRDNGRTWQTIVQSHPSAGEGYHSYDWDVPCINDGDIRVRVRGYLRFSFFNAYRAGDGSFDECRIRRTDPSPPGGLAVDDDFVYLGDSYTVGWNAVTGADSYELSENGKWQDVGKATSRTFTKNEEGQYSYRIRAVGACATSGSSQPVTATVQIRLTAPQNLQVGARQVQAGESTTLSWDPVTGATGYQVSINGTWQETGPEPHFTILQEEDGTFEYRVRALGRFMTGPTSAPIQVLVRTICTVWPGDLNADGTVDAADVLPLATYWGETGDPRTRVDLAWVAHVIDAWEHVPATYADANGDGRVGIEDFLAVCINWGRSHGDDEAAATGVADGAQADRTVLLQLLEQVRHAVAGPEAEIRAYLEDKLDAAPALSFAVYPNHPNPFNPSTRIAYDIPHESRVTVEVYNVAGRLVKRLVDRRHRTGHHSVVWNGDDVTGRRVSSGIYFYRVDGAGMSHVGKMTLVK